MKRLTAYLKGKMTESKVSNSEKRVELAIETAKLNFKSSKEELQLKLENTIEKLGEPKDVYSTLQELVSIYQDIDDAETGIAILERLEKYLNEDIKVKE